MLVATCIIFRSKEKHSGEITKLVPWRNHLRPVDFEFKCLFLKPVFSVDATSELKHKGLKGRLLNHSRSAPNAETKVIEMDDGSARLAFFALKTIHPGLELKLISSPQREPEDCLVHLFQWPWCLYCHRWWIGLRLWWQVQRIAGFESLAGIVSPHRFGGTGEHLCLFGGSAQVRMDHPAIWTENLNPSPQMSLLTSGLIGAKGSSVFLRIFLFVSCYWTPSSCSRYAVFRLFLLSTLN